MNCPNCNQPFVLRYDYARHLRGCRPHDASGDGGDGSPAIRRHAADAFIDEIDFDVPSLSDECAPATVLAGERG